MRSLLVAVLVLFSVSRALAEDAPATAPAAFDTSATVALLGRNIIVTMHDGGVSAGTLAEAGPHKIVLVLLTGAQVAIDAAQIESIRLGPASVAPAPAASVPTPATARSTDEESGTPAFDHEKRAADHDRAERVADLKQESANHANAAVGWYVGAGAGTLAAIGLCGGWFFLLASPLCLVGAGVGVVTAAACGIVGLMESGAAQKSENDAHAMAY